MVTLQDYFLENPKLKSQWNANKNAVLTHTLSTRSREKVWWRCQNGHEWQASIDSRVNLGRGCPCCAGQLVSAGENDFATVTPENLPLWHPEKNGGLDPSTVMPGSNRLLWWKCERGHEWQARAYAIKAGCACPYCSGRLPIVGETDLATVHPHLIKMWSPRNKLLPTEVTAASHKKVWWICEKGHEWEAKIDTVTIMGCGCPYCAGKRAIPGETDLETLCPELTKQWDWEKNGKLRPSTLLPSSHEKVWWLCELGHSYQAVIFSRSREKGTGCPYCAGKKVLAGFNDLATLKPKVAKEWHPTLNGELRPDDVTLGSNKRVWWKCHEGHVWQAMVFSRTRKKGSGCPVCAGTVKTAKRKANPRKMDQRSLRV